MDHRKYSCKKEHIDWQLNNFSFCVKNKGIGRFLKKYISTFMCNGMEVEFQSWPTRQIDYNHNYSFKFLSWQCRRESSYVPKY